MSRIGQSQEPKGRVTRITDQLESKGSTLPYSLPIPTLVRDTQPLCLDSELSVVLYRSLRCSGMILGSPEVTSEPGSDISGLDVLTSPRCRMSTSPYLS